MPPFPCPNCAKPAPEGAVECAFCGVIFAKFKPKPAAEAPPPAPPRPAASDWSGTLTLLACFCVAVYGAYRVYERRVEPPVKKTGVTINPEAYKEQIVALEAALYGASPPTYQDAQAISHEAGKIAGALLSKYQHNPLVRDAAAEVMEFSEAVGGAAEALTMPPTARPDWQRRWETLRAKRFEPAGWFHAPLAVAPGGPPDFEKAAHEILAARDALKGILEIVPAEFAQFGDGEVNLATGRGDVLQRPAEDVPGQWAGLEKADKKEAAQRQKADAARLEDWRLWVANWKMRVDGALVDFPNSRDIPPELEAAYGTLVRAGQAASSPPNPGPGAFLTASDPRYSAVYLPGKYARDAWVGNITDWLGGIDASIEAARQAKKK